MVKDERKRINFMVSDFEWQALTSGMVNAEQSKQILAWKKLNEKLIREFSIYYYLYRSGKTRWKFIHKYQTIKKKSA
ncbi:MAG: hypothetical protein L3J21_01065 [Devosiaceae bacterium]|nr:hypothetical protein [Devosiaceae bacterium]